MKETSRLVYANEPETMEQVVSRQICLVNAARPPSKNVLNDLITIEMARSISMKLHSNSGVVSAETLGNNVPRSAFFIRHGTKFYLDQGEKQSSGVFSIHRDLRWAVDYTRWCAEGACLRSGHVGKLLIGQNEFNVALFDSVFYHTEINIYMPEYLMMLTLMNNDFLVVSSDGFPVNLQKIFM